MSCELAFEEVGVGAPLLLLHGLFGASSNWRGIAKTLAVGRRVISADLRNHGASPWTPTMTYDDMVDDVAALIDRLALDAPAVLGHSMGGKVAMALALRRPERVGRLVVVDVAPVSYPDHFSPYIDAMRALDVHAPTREAMRRALLVDIPEERVVHFLMTNLVRRDAGYAWRINLDALGSAMSAIRGFPTDLAGRRYDGPVTVIDGALSDYIAASDRPLFTEFFPRARFATIDGAGHWLHADRPDAFVAAVREALAA